MRLSNVQYRILKEVSENESGVCFSGLIPEEDSAQRLYFKRMLRLANSPRSTPGDCYVLSPTGRRALELYEQRRDNPKPELGQWVLVKAFVTKSHDGKHTRWVRISYPTPRAGIYTGSRTVYSGVFEENWTCQGEDVYEGSYFSPTDQHDVWKVVFKDRENGVFAFPPDVEAK